MAKLTDKKASVFYILTKRLLLHTNTTALCPDKLVSRGSGSIRALTITTIIYVGILCFESEVFNFLFSNFSFK
jgi:hypothetical protein